MFEGGVREGRRSVTNFSGRIGEVAAEAYVGGVVLVSW